MFLQLVIIILKLKLNYTCKSDFSSRRVQPGILDSGNLVITMKIPSKRVTMVTRFRNQNKT